MLFKIVFLSLLVVLMVSQPNYQERVIFYGEHDGLCCTTGYEQISLIINVNDREIIRRAVSGNNKCSMYIYRCIDGIRPADSIQLKTSHELINFHQDTRFIYVLGSLYQVIQNVTVVNPATINGTSYACTIFGDGTLQHYGVYGESSTAEIYMRCLPSAAQSQAEEAQANLKVEQEVK